MNTETVTVQYVNAPKPGKKMGSIKTADGRYIGCWPDKLVRFQQGGTYTIKTETQGDFTKVVDVVGNDAPTQQQAPQQRSVGRPTDDATAERIYVCGVVNAAISSGLEVTTGTLVGITNAAREAYRQTFGGQAATGQREAPMPNDAIPF